MCLCYKGAAQHIMQNGGLCRTRWTTQPLLPTKAMSISCLIIS